MFHVEHTEMGPGSRAKNPMSPCGARRHPICPGVAKWQIIRRRSRAHWL